MGAGGSLEASIQLKGPIPAGTWHLVGDGIVSASVDVTFEVIWRTQAGADTLLASWFHHFDPVAGFSAVPFEADATGVAAAAADGDRLVLRMTGTSSVAAMAYIPNGDGALVGGRIPNLTLPR